jgi:hypothetical protein
MALNDGWPSLKFTGAPESWHRGLALNDRVRLANGVRATGLPVRSAQAFSISLTVARANLCRDGINRSYWKLARWRKLTRGR